MPERSGGFLRSRLHAAWIPVAVALLVLPGSARAGTEEECVTCHAEVGAAFAGSTHGRAFAFGSDHKGAGCAACHGDGAAHVEAGGDKSKILNPAKADPARSNGSCLSCHENQPIHTFWQGSAHEAAGVRCAECHAVHREIPVRKPGTTLNDSTARCLSCHPAQRKGINQRSRHPLLEGKMDCVSCHNPHGSQGEALVRADSVNDLCYSCHQEKRGPFLWEHSPVREACLTCHTPHGSSHDKLMVARPVQVCQSCHLQGRHQTVAGLPEAFWNTNRQCLNCHSQIHGSNHPSGPLFQR